MFHFSTLAAEYGLKETETYKRFESNMNDLGFTIGSFIKGMKGERIAKRALKLISFDKNVKILYNIALEDEDVQAEYDAIVITPYGIFVVEVKNWGAEMHIDENGILWRNDQNIKYDLPGRMSAKEGLLREYLGDIFPDKYQGMVLFSNENTERRSQKAAAKKRLFLQLDEMRSRVLPNSRENVAEHRKEVFHAIKTFLKVVKIAIYDGLAPLERETKILSESSIQSDRMFAFGVQAMLDDF